MIRASLQPLEQSRLLTITPNGDLFVVHLTREGQEVAEGRTRADGVEPYTVECPY